MRDGFQVKTRHESAIAVRIVGGQFQQTMNDCAPLLAQAAARILQGLRSLRQEVSRAYAGISRPAQFTNPGLDAVHAIFETSKA